jgi:hypothetical protein
MEDNQKRPEKQAPGFIKLSRSNEVTELMHYPIACTLLMQIGLRAKRTAGQFNPHNLQIGEALVGDHQSIGASEQNYRTAKAQLGKWGFASFRPTPKGTIARLLNTRVFDINGDNDPSNDPANEQCNDPFTEGKRGQANDPYHSPALSASTQKPPPPITTKKKPRSEEVKNSDSENLAVTSTTQTHDLRHASVFDEEKRRQGAETWRAHYDADELNIIDLYNATCAPRGWWPVDADSEELHSALNAFQDHDLDWFKSAFDDAVAEREAGDPEYNNPRGNKLIRILWANY